MSKTNSKVEVTSFTIENIVGKRIDLSEIFLTLNIYESIFDFFLHGRCIISDTIDLVSNFPLVGNEKIEIILNDGDVERVLYFRLYKIDRDLKSFSGAKKTKALLFYFCSEEKIKDSLIKISKKLEDKPENIINSLFSDNFKSKKNIDTTSGLEKLTIFSNFWQPSKLIDFVLRTSKTAKYSDFVFFERMDGFVFKPISELMMQNSPHDEIFYGNDLDSADDVNNIKVFRFDKYFDILMNAKAGVFGNKLYNFDPIKYEHSVIEGTYGDVVNDFGTLGNNQLFSEDLHSVNNRVIHHHYESDIASVRPVSLNSLNNYNLVAKFNGDIAKRCGDTVHVMFPNFDNEVPLSNAFSGHFMISEINHAFNANGDYEQNMMLVKNAFYMNEDLPKINSMRNGG